MTDREAMKQALDALEMECVDNNGNKVDLVAPAIEALRQALAQPEQKPVAWMCWNMPDERYEITTDKRRLPAGTPLYTEPQSKPWVSLTDDEIHEAAIKCVKSGQSVNAAIRAIEAKLKEKNT